MTKSFDDDDWRVSVRAGVVEVERDGEVVGKGHWDGRRVVHPDYQLDDETAEKLDKMVSDSLPNDAWENADRAADEIVGHMSEDDKSAMQQSGDAEAWRQDVADDHRADGLDHNAVLRAMYQLIKLSRGTPED